MLRLAARALSASSRKLSTAAGADEAALRASILAAALKHVPAHGWSTHALAAGAADVGLSPSSHAVVSGGGAELVAHFQRAADERLRAELAQLGDDLEPYAAARPPGRASRAHAVRVR